MDVIHGRSPALLPSSLSFFPYARVTFQVSWDCLPACLFRPPAPISLSLLHPPRARPPGPFQSISNLKFYETKLKLTSHLEAAGTGHGMGTQRPSASPLPTLSFSLSISHPKFPIQHMHARVRVLGTLAIDPLVAVH